MDPLTAAAPAPMVPVKKRRPFDPAMVPPQAQAALASGQPFPMEDGSVFYPDGTFEGAGDSPDDWEMPQGMDYGAGGYNAGMAGGGAMMGGGDPLMAGAPSPMMGGGPFTDPMTGAIAEPFTRHFATRNAPMPGTPGGVGGGPLVDPMADPFADAPAAAVEDPFFLAAPESATAPADAVAARRQSGGVSQPQESGSYGGRYGRRRSSSTTSTRRR